VTREIEVDLVFDEDRLQRFDHGIFFRVGTLNTPG